MNDLGKLVSLFPVCLKYWFCVCLFVSWLNASRSGTIVWEGYPLWGLKQWEDVPHTHIHTHSFSCRAAGRRCLQGVWRRTFVHLGNHYKSHLLSCSRITWQDCMEKQRHACWKLVVHIALQLNKFLPQQLYVVVHFYFLSSSVVVSSSIWMTSEVIRGHDQTAHAGVLSTVPSVCHTKVIPKYSNSHTDKNIWELKIHHPRDPLDLVSSSRELWPKYILWRTFSILKIHLSVFSGGQTI